VFQISHLILFLIRVPRPANQDAFFIDIIVKAPIIPIFSIILGLVIVAFEYPAPFMKGIAAQRSLISRVVLLFFQAFFAIFFYQVRFLPISLHH
jgi:ATP adenylyltransferase